MHVPCLSDDISDVPEKQMKFNNMHLFLLYLYLYNCLHFLSICVFVLPSIDIAIFELEKVSVRALILSQDMSPSSSLIEKFLKKIMNIKVCTPKIYIMFFQTKY